MQVEARAGNIGGVRPRFSTNPVAEDPPAAPGLGAIPIETDPFLVADELNFTDVLPDAAGQAGLYRVVLTDIDGGRWVVWTRDPPDVRGPEVQVRLPFLDGLGLPLAPGDLDCRIQLFAWPTLDPSGFLWTDVEREYDLFSRSSSRARSRWRSRRSPTPRETPPCRATSCAARSRARWSAAATPRSRSTSSTARSSTRPIARARSRNRPCCCSTSSAGTRTSGT